MESMEFVRFGGVSELKIASENQSVRVWCECERTKGDRFFFVCLLLGLRCGRGRAFFSGVSQQVFVGRMDVGGRVAGECSRV